tara:strand:- start:117 stop:650 length:534 start_codon:yes stop_codon:yes gene_type:complete
MMELSDAIIELQQPRSRYQLEHFVVGQHDTAEMQFYQCVLELQSELHKYRLADISKRRMLLEIEQLSESDDPMDVLDVEEKQAELEMLVAVMGGAEREINCLLDMYREMPHFTRDEIDHAQPDYWEKRLTRQTNLQIMSGNVGWAQLDSMRQAGLLEEMVETREAQLAEQAKAELGQ